MTKRNYCARFAYSRKDALAQLQEESDIEVVFLDVKMPGWNGIKTLKRIKERWPLVEVVMLTAHSTIGSAINAIKLGACDYLLKPIEIEQLVSKIEEAVRRKRHRDKLILEVYMTPYLTQREREAKIAKILHPDTKRGGVQFKVI